MSNSEQQLPLVLRLPKVFFVLGALSFLALIISIQIKLLQDSKAPLTIVCDSMDESTCIYGGWTKTPEGVVRETVSAQQYATLRGFGEALSVTPENLSKGKKVLYILVNQREEG